MAIRKEQPGAAKAAAQAGLAIGKGKRAEEDRARAERGQARAQQIAAQQSARQAAMEWEQQKMALNSQQDFAHEMRMRQAGLDKEARAEEWQVEKMEMASRFDFEQSEKERLRTKAEYTAGRDTLDKKKDEMPAGEYERALFRLDSIYAPKGVDTAVEGLGYKEERQLSIAEQQQRLLSPEEQEQKALISAGIEPRAATHRAQTHRDKLLDIVGSVYEDDSLPEIEAAAIEAGYDPRTYEEFDPASEQLVDLGLDPTDFPVAGVSTKPTPESLRALGTKEAYEKGRQLGYWK